MFPKKYSQFSMSLDTGIFNKIIKVNSLYFFAYSCVVLCLDLFFGIPLKTFKKNIGVIMVPFYLNFLDHYNSSKSVCLLLSMVRMKTDCNLKTLHQLFKGKLLCCRKMTKKDHTLFSVLQSHHSFCTDNTWL